MSKHFAYLTQHNDADFFQKVASEQAESRMPAASMTLMKTAMQNLLEGVTFEKVAARLDRDIHILKTAGESGMNLGMQKRAGAYIDQLLEQCEMTPEEFDRVFEKVAGEAIMGDLVVAQAHLSQGLDEDGLSWLNGELTKIGAELTELANMEKEAFLGALRAIGGGLRALGGRGIGAVAKAGRGAAALPGKAVHAIRDARISRGVSGLEKTKKQIDLAQNTQRALQASGKGSGLRSGLRSTYNQGKIKSLESQAAGKKQKVDSLIAKQHASRGVVSDAPKPPPIPASAKAPKPSPKIESASAPKPAAAPAKGDSAATDAAKAATKPDAPPPTTAKDTKPDDLSLNATKTEGATLKGAYEKMRDKGWKSLDQAEKQKLINAGVATVVGGRVITGHGILTGGEGII